MRLFYIFIFCFSILQGCQSKPIKQFESLKLGMEKADVLEAMGTPWATTRFHGKDRWIYVIYNDGVRGEKEVHFQNGAAVYVGDAWTPPPEQTAVGKDKKNEELEKQFQEESAKIKAENKNAFSNYEQEVKGEGKKIKYIPDYVEMK